MTTLRTIFIGMMTFFSVSHISGAPPSLNVVSISVGEENVEILAFVAPSVETSELQDSSSWNSRIGVLCLVGGGANSSYPLVANFDVTIFGSDSRNVFPVSHAPMSPALGVYNKSVYELIFPRFGAMWPQGCDPILFKVPLALIAADLVRLDQLKISVKIDAQVYTSGLVSASSQVVESERLSISEDTDQLESPFPAE